MKNRANRRPVNGREVLISLALFIAATAVALLLIEAALRLMGRAPMYVSPERDRFWKYHPLLGWAHQPGQEGIFQTRQFRTAVHINQKGLRDHEHAYERTDGTRRILVLGDSFAWGYGVEENQRFSQLLEASLGVEAINAGVSGYSTDQELIWFQTEGIKYDTDLVILVLAGNDVGDNEQQIVSNIYYKPQFVIEDGSLVLKNDPVPRTSTQGKVIYYLSQRSSLFYFLAQRYFDFLAVYRNFKVNAENTNPSLPATPSASGPFDLTIALIHEINDLARSKDAKFMIVTTDRWWNSAGEDTYSDFINRLRTEGFLVLDVESMPGFNPGEMLIPDDGHWSQVGHEFVAKKISEFMQKNQLLTQP